MYVSLFRQPTGALTTRSEPSLPTHACIAPPLPCALADML
jgi:hypothetical protein